MALTYVPHEKISIKKHPGFNEAWLHQRICDDPSILGLGDVRVLDHEKPCPGGGRLDLLLYDDDTNRRYEVEVMLGATDPSHIIRTIEYWDLERRRYPGYEHVAVLVAEDVTARFLNVISLLSGSIPLIAIQLDALRVGDNLVLGFVQVLDQTELRIDDTDDDGGGGGEANRAYWDQRAGVELMETCDRVVEMINEATRSQHSLNYLRRYLGLQSNGVVNNFMLFSPKPSKKVIHIRFRNANALRWKVQFEAAGVPVASPRKGRFRITVSAEEFRGHEDLIREAVSDTVKDAGV